MTTMSITAYTCKICENVANYFSKVLKRLQFARQMSANKIVAEQLIHLGHHNQKEYHQVLQRMNDHTINEYHERY